MRRCLTPWYPVHRPLHGSTPFGVVAKGRTIYSMTIGAPRLVPIGYRKAPIAATLVRARNTDRAARDPWVAAPTEALGDGGGRRAATSGGIDAAMSGIHVEPRDPPACPLLGLATDRRSHSTYPHSGHRCYAGIGPGTIDTRRQAACCLNRRFLGCDHFRSCLERISRSGPEAPSPSVR